MFMVLNKLTRLSNSIIARSVILSVIYRIQIDPRFREKHPRPWQAENLMFLCAPDKVYGFVFDPPHNNKQLRVHTKSA